MAPVTQGRSDFRAGPNLYPKEEEDGVEPEQLPALLDATSGMGHVLLAVLAGAGLRIGEALALR